MREPLHRHAREGGHPVITAVAMLQWRWVLDYPLTRMMTAKILIE
jgi:hypothetical protein